jgi:hypothetical protein
MKKRVNSVHFVGISSLPARGTTPYCKSKTHYEVVGYLVIRGMG